MTGEERRKLKEKVSDELRRRSRPRLYTVNPDRCFKSEEEIERLERERLSKARRRLLAKAND